jgi:hypothetical protein
MRRPLRASTLEIYQRLKALVSFSLDFNPRQLVLSGI